MSSIPASHHERTYYAPLSHEWVTRLLNDLETGGIKEKAVRYETGLVLTSIAANMTATPERTFLTSIGRGLMGDKSTEIVLQVALSHYMSHVGGEVA